MNEGNERFNVKAVSKERSLEIKVNVISSKDGLPGVSRPEYIKLTSPLSPT